MTDHTDRCPGPWIWFDAPDAEVMLECATCGQIHVGSGVPFDEAHADTQLIREGLR